MYSEILFICKERGNQKLGGQMNRTGKYHAEGGNPDLERQIQHALSYLWIPPLRPGRKNEKMAGGL